MRQAVLAALFLHSALAADSELERARDKQDRPMLDRLAAQYASGAQSAPKDPEAQYRAALAASYDAEVALEVKDKEKARRAAESGIAPAERAISLKPANGEYYRILATLYGQVIPANPMAGLSYGKKAKDAIGKALELSPKSATVHMAEGVGNYYMPAMFGGGPELAAKNFREAIALDPKSAEAYLWLALAQKKLHKNAEARQSLAKSLELNPSRIWAKDQLEKTPAQ
jgi:tetratricopeptide (TPR) repeat protein